MDLNYFDISVSTSQSHNAELVMQQLLPVQSVLNQTRDVEQTIQETWN